jgi:hypothetical protein
MAVPPLEKLVVETWFGCLSLSLVPVALILDSGCGASGLVRVAWFLLPLVEGLLSESSDTSGAADSLVLPWKRSSSSTRVAMM